MRTYIVDFWMSDATPKWRISAAGETFQGTGDSRQDAIDGAKEKLEQLERQPMSPAQAAAPKETEA
jgi:hypothetical protein